VREGKVSPEQARADYGVVLTADGAGIDEEATLRLRHASMGQL